MVYKCFPYPIARIPILDESSLHLILYSMPKLIFTLSFTRCCITSLLKIVPPSHPNFYAEIMLNVEIIIN